VYEAMVAMGLLRVPTAFAGPPDLAPDHGRGRHVVVLGAGIAGLTAAYELSRAGYRVTVLEAKARAGGRSFTVRRGDVIEETTGSRQVCRFDEGPQMYLNAGPGRLPYHHTALLHYCTVLGVELEVYTMMTRANLFQRDGVWGGEPTLNRRIANDTRGWIADLLAKAVDKGALEGELGGVDKAGLLKLLSSFGDVAAKDRYDYRGSSRSGYAVDPGIEDCGRLLPPLTLADLVRSEFWAYRVSQAEEYEWQPTLFQPARGMDQIWKAFLKKVGRLVRYGREVIGVHNDPERHKISIRHRHAGGSGDGEVVTADWCISTIPLPILAAIKDNNFSEDFREAVGAVSFASTCKVGWQADARFWERQGQIYGGISYIDHNITQMWYPSYAYFSKKGILTGAYNYDGDADAMAKLEPPQRLELAMQGARKLHADFDRHVPLRLGLSIAWKQVPYQLGGWADNWFCDDLAYERLLEPDGRFWVAGDQVSYLSGWQEGAVRSAHHVIDGIARPSRRSKPAAAPKVEVPVLQRPPDVRRRTRGLP
jgi:monoamine oxidase